MGSFTAVMFRIEGPGGWTFVEVPAGFAPVVVGPWGRTPVTASVDGKTWATSVWRERSGRVLLPVPKRIRGGKEAGDEVEVLVHLR
ncbi:MAG: DUF1905 domain-containing protein [Myxococcota bacterium]